MRATNLQTKNIFTKEEDIERILLSDPCAKRFFENHKLYNAFEDSWYALIQGIRHNPSLYKKKIYFSNHPHKPQSISVYNHLCSTIPELVDHLQSLLIELDKEEVIWKNADPNNLGLLHRYGFKCYNEVDGWDSVARYDDQTYPQYVCLLEEIASLKGSQFGQIRQQTRAVERLYNNELTLEKYRKEHKNECKELAIHTSHEIGKAKDLDIPQIANATLLYLDHPPEYTFIIRHKEEILSFIAFDVRSNTANFNCLIYQREPKYVATYAMVSAAKELHNRGVEKLNLSGSEFKSLDHWKHKFNPVKKIERTHVILSRK